MEQDFPVKDIENIIRIVGLIAGGDASMVDTLLQYTDESKNPKLVADLAEHIGSIIVQKEGREFLLELMLEDKLKAQTELENAKHDALTGVPNRVLFQEMLAKRCEDARAAGTIIALLFVDLDRFKEVNDTMGHDAGDEVLRQATHRMLACVKEAGFVARLGGDEFTVVLHSFQGDPVLDSQKISKNIISELTRSFDITAGRVEIGASIGMTFFPADADNHITLLKNADIAMYRAKDAGRNTYKLYSEGRGRRR